MERNTTGISLIELLVGISILGVTATVGIPALKESYRKIQLTSTSQTLYSLTQHARLSALTRQTRTSLCPLSTLGECSDDWQQPLSIFTDRNGNRRLDPDDEILKTQDMPGGVEISWRGMGNNKSLHFNQQGITFVSNGTFHLRSGSQSTRLTISRLGKAKSESATSPPAP